MLWNSNKQFIPASNAYYAAPKKNLAGTNMMEIFAPV